MIIKSFAGFVNYFFQKFCGLRTDGRKKAAGLDQPCGLEVVRLSIRFAGQLCHVDLDDPHGGK